VCGLDGPEEVFLGDLVTAAFDHHHRVGGAGDDDVDPAALVLRHRGVEDELAVFVAADADRGDRCLEG
jgi:hypothetical protein